MVSEMPKITIPLLTTGEPLDVAEGRKLNPWNEGGITTLSPFDAVESHPCERSIVLAD